MYRAGARILLELEDEHSLAVEGVGSTQNTEYALDPEPYFQTQYRILTGRDLALSAVHGLDLRIAARVQRHRAPAAGRVVAGAGRADGGGPPAPRRARDSRAAAAVARPAFTSGRRRPR